MGLKDALDAEAARSRSGPRCTVCTLLDTLPKDDAAALAEYLANPVVHGSMIARALTAEGHHVNASTVVRHRRGDCAGQ